MAKVKVYWTETALKVVEAIGDYIAQDAPEKAIEFTVRLLAFNCYAPTHTK